MKTVVVFPIADLRRFSGFADTYLPRPSWVSPEENREFVRALGGLKYTNDCGISLRGLDGWIVEPFVCDATSGPKFHDMPAMAASGRHFQWKVERRLFFFDGTCSARVEYHFQCDLTKAQSPISFDEVNDYLCNLRLKVRRHEGSDGSEFDHVDFGRSGLLHARTLAARTVPKGRFSELHLVRRFIKYLRPAIIHIVQDGERVEIGSQFARVSNTTSRYLDIFHDRVRIFGNIDIPVWAIRAKRKLNDRDLRDLVLYLRRLHSEYECLKRILVEVDRGNVPINDGSLSPEFEQYVRDILRRVRSAETKLLRSSSFAPEKNPSEPTMVELASISIHDLDPTLFAQIQSALKRLRFNWVSNERNLIDFVEQLQERATTININVRELNMDNRQTVTNSSGVVLTQAGRDAQVNLDRSFNGLQDRTSSAELVQSIANLKELLDQALESGEVKSPEALARDFAELTAEVSSKEPRAEKVAFSGSMVLSAIKESSSLITSVSKAIEVLRGLFPT